MPDPKVAFISAFPLAWNQEVASYAPKNYAVTIVAHEAPDEEKIAAVKDADFLVLHPGPISERVLRSATRLKLVQLIRVGYDLVDLKLLKELGIPFARLRDATAGIVADHTVLLMLAVYRQLLASDRAVRSGAFFEAVERLPFYEMQDKTVGILGLGNIGLQVARRVQGFGCRVQYHNRRRLPPEEEARLGVHYVEFRELLVTSDILALLVPLTPETRHIVGREELRLMKRTAVLVNTGRGALVDEPALVEALREGRLAGAGLDVFDPMPPKPDNPLLKLDNVVLTPYSAAEAETKTRRIGEFVWRNLQAVWEGREPQGLVAG